MTAALLSTIENSRKRGKGTPLRYCLVDSCDGLAKSKSLCQKHYYRYVKFGNPLFSPRPQNGEKKRFLDALIESNDQSSDECVFWPFRYRKIGYGTFSDGGVELLAHRYVCEKIHGAPERDGLHAAHSCGRGAEGCIAPNHLRWATPAENEADKVLHRRGAQI